MEYPIHARGVTLRRTPQGVRGLKFPIANGDAEEEWSHPARGAWIEISTSPIKHTADFVAPRKGCVD